MDSRLRQILRNGSAEEAYAALARTGLSLDEIEKQLIANGKITEELGAFEDIRVRLKLFTLAEARKLVAEEAFQQYKFPSRVIWREQEFWQQKSKWFHFGLYVEH